MKIRQVGARAGALLLCAATLIGFGCEGSALRGPESPTDGGSDIADVAPDVPAPDATPDTELPDATPDAEPDAGDVGDAGPDVVTPDPDWEPVFLGDLGVIDGLVAVSADEAYAVSRHRVLRYNGVTWAPFGSPQADVDLHGVWSDGQALVVVGDGGLIARRALSAGAAWEVMDSGVSVALWAVAGRAADDLVAVGDDGVVLRHEGEGWDKRHERGSIRLRGVFVDPEAEGDEGIRAVGSGGFLVQRDGSEWRGVQIAASNAILSGFTQMADGTLIAVGTRHTLTALRPGSPAWQGETSNDARQRDVHAVWTGRDGVVRAFGAEGLVLRREGLSWQVDAGPGNTVGIKNFSVASGFGTGASAGLLALARDGGGVSLRSGTWSSIATSLDATVKAFAEDTHGRLWAVGSGGLLMVLGDFGWTSVPLPTQAALNDVASDGEGGVWVVGAAGRLLRVSASLEVAVLDVDVPVDLFGVKAASGKVVACGRGGTLFVLDPSIDGPGALQVRTTGTVADLRAVTIDAEDTVWVSGAFGTLLSGPLHGGAMTQVITGTGGTLHALALDGSTLLASGDNGVILRVTSSGEVEVQHEAPGVFLYGLAARDGQALAVGSGATILVRDGDSGAWISERSAALTATFEAVILDADGQAWAGSNRREASVERRLEPMPTGAQ